MGAAGAGSGCRVEPLRPLGLALVLPHPFADRVVGDAVLASDGEVARRLDFAQKLWTRRTLNLARPESWLSEVGVPGVATLRGRPRAVEARERAVPMPNRSRREGTATADTVPFARKVASAMRVEGGIAVRAQKAQVLEPVVVGNTVDVIRISDIFRPCQISPCWQSAQRGSKTPSSRRRALRWPRLKAECSTITSDNGTRRRRFERRRARLGLK